MINTNLEFVDRSTCKIYKFGVILISSILFKHYLWEHIDMENSAGNFVKTLSVWYGNNFQEAIFEQFPLLVLSLNRKQ